MMEDFGVTSTFDGGSYTVAAGSCYENPDGEYAIEPDVSAACYFYAAAALTGSRICVKGIHRDLMQGDLAFLDVLERMGATVSESPDGIILEGAPDGTLHGITVDMNHFSDQALTLAAIAPFADSPVTITGIAHIRGQESDRIQAMEENLDAAGIRTETTNDSITIFPGQPHGCRMKTYQDHRVAMAFSLPGLLVPGVIIDDPGCCKKTFPEYFDVIDIAYY